MTISTIITAYDNHELTKVHVKACMNSSRVPDEIIVVNDHGDPNLRDLLKDLEINTKLIYVYIKDDINWNYTGARNLGFVLSTGDILVTEDNDNIPSMGLYSAYEKFFYENSDIDLCWAGKRPKVKLKDALTKPLDEWESQGTRPWHRDTFAIRRLSMWRLRGYDERLAGAYAWASADIRRRIGRAKFKTGHVSNHYFSVLDEDESTLKRRKSYRNYEIARKNDYIQPPGKEAIKDEKWKLTTGIINFNYEIEVL